MQVYQRTENGTVSEISIREGLDEINHVMMGGSTDVVEVSQISRTDYSIKYKDGRIVRLIRAESDYSIKYKDGRIVRLVRVKAGDAREWHGTHSRSNHLHRFTEDNGARCNRRIRANAKPPVGGGAWGVFKRTRSEVESGPYADTYTFCPRCEKIA